MKSFAQHLRMPHVSVLLGITVLFIMTYGLRRFGVWFMLVPAVAFTALLAGRRFFPKPVAIFSLFLFTAVNLNFFRGEVLSADIITSAFIMYLLMVRIGLQGAPFLKTPIERAYLIYLLAIVPSVVLSLNPAMSFKNWFRDFEYLVLILFIFSLQPTMEQKRTLLGAVIFSSLIPCLVGFIGMIFEIPLFYGNTAPLGSGEIVLRVQSTLTHPATFAQYLFTVSIITLAMIFDGGWFKRRYLVPLFLAQIYLLYFGYSRVMWGEFLIGIAILLWLFRYRRFLFLGLPLAITALLVFVPTFLDRWSTAAGTEDNSLFIRFAIWLKALSLFPNRPIFGSGPDTFSDYVSVRDYGAHNTWIKLLIESGLLGLITFIAVIIVSMRSLLQRVRASGARQDPVVASSFAILVAYLVASWMTDPFEVPAVNVYSWTALAIALLPSGSGKGTEPDGLR